MDIDSLRNYVVTNQSQDGLFDLFDTFILFRDDIELFEYEVKSWEEMRIDLVFQSMYNLESNEVGLFLSNIDIILFLNGIDNPVNIKSGMILKFPTIEKLAEFRFREDSFSSTKKSTTPALAVPNVSTKKDKSREDYKKNGYSLPPVVLTNPTPPVRIEDGQIKVGGLN